MIIYPIEARLASRASFLYCVGKREGRYGFFFWRSIFSETYQIKRFHFITLKRCTFPTIHTCSCNTPQNATLGVKEALRKIKIFGILIGVWIQLTHLNSLQSPRTIVASQICPTMARIARKIVLMASAAPNKSINYWFSWIKSFYIYSCEVTFEWTDMHLEFLIRYVECFL